MLDVIKSTYLFALKKSYLLLLVAAMMLLIDFVDSKITAHMTETVIIIFIKAFIWVLWLHFLLQVGFQWKKLFLLTLVFPLLVYLIKVLSLLPYLFIKVFSYYLMGSYVAHLIGFCAGGAIALCLIARLSIVFSILVDSRFSFQRFFKITKGRNTDWLVAGFLIFLPLIILNNYWTNNEVLFALPLIFSSTYYRKYNHLQI